MRSGTVLDRHSHTADAAVTELLVLWQHPGTREIHAIGRLSHDADRFTFAYTRAAADIVNFRPLLGFNDLHRHYSSSALPAVFGQRVMARDRPDYATYVQSLGLDPERATPWEQIVHSGGTRHGDTLQFMAVPRVVDGRARACFLVNGLSHIAESPREIVGGRTIQVDSEQHEATVQSLRSGDLVQLQAEVKNPRDQNAVLVTLGEIPLGWAPRFLAPSLRDLMSAGPIPARVERAAPPNTPAHTRIVLDIDLPAPSSFEFDRAQRWAPLTTQ